MMDPRGFAPTLAAEFPNDNPSLHEGVSWICLRVSGPPRPVVRPRALPRQVTAFAAARLAEVSAPDTTAAEGLATSASSLDAGTVSRDAEAKALEPLQLELTPVDGLCANVPRNDEKLELSDVSDDTRGDDASDDSSDDGFVLESAFAEPTRVESVFAEPTLAEPIDARDDASVATVTALTEDPATEVAASSDEVGNGEPDPFVAFVSAMVDVALAGGATRAAAELPAVLEGASGELTPAVAASIVAWRSVLRAESNDFSACGTSTLDNWATDLLKTLGVAQTPAFDIRRELRRRGVAAFGMLVAA